MGKGTPQAMPITVSAMKNTLQDGLRKLFEDVYSNIGFGPMNRDAWPNAVPLGQSPNPPKALSDAEIAAATTANAMAAAGQGRPIPASLPAQTMIVPSQLAQQAQALMNAQPGQFTPLGGSVTTLPAWANQYGQSLAAQMQVAQQQANLTRMSMQQAQNVLNATWGGGGSGVALQSMAHPASPPLQSHTLYGQHVLDWVRDIEDHNATHRLPKHKYDDWAMRLADRRNLYDQYSVVHLEHALSVCLANGVEPEPWLDRLRQKGLTVALVGDPHR